MDLQLKGKKALITGSTEGIGFAIANALHKEGADVYINGRTKEKVEAAAKQIGDHATPLPFDLGTKDGAESLLKVLPEVDILINNLGIYEIKPFEKITDEDWVHILEVNVLSGVRLSRAYLPKMLKKNGGRILFISSESGLQIPAEMIHYGVTKASQIALARGLAELTAGSQVTVNSILPGPTYSEGVEKFVVSIAKEKGITKEDVEKEFFTSLRPSSLIKRFATAEEVASLVAFISSPLSSAINGSALRVEGGVVKYAF